MLASPFAGLDALAMLAEQTIARGELSVSSQKTQRRLKATSRSPRSATDAGTTRQPLECGRHPNAPNTNAEKTAQLPKVKEEEKTPPDAPAAPDDVPATPASNQNPPSTTSTEVKQPDLKKPADVPTSSDAVSSLKKIKPRAPTPDMVFEDGLPAFVALRDAQDVWRCKRCRIPVRDTQLHWRAEHSRKTRDFTCPRCRKKFADRYKYGRHMMIHSGVRPFACSTCGKRFRHKHHLQNHVLSVHQNRGVPCPVCGRSFSQISNVRRHLRRKRKCQPPGATADKSGTDKAASDDKTAAGKAITESKPIADKPAGIAW